MKNRIKLEDLPPEFQRQARAQLQDSSAVSTGSLEQSTRNEPKRTHAPKKVKPRSYISGVAEIRISSKRRRLTDANQLCDKWVIDALVIAGVIYDDDPAHVESVTQTQQQIPIQEKEETIVTITERSQ